MMHHEGAPRPMALNHTFKRLQLHIDLQHPRLPATYLQHMGMDNGISVQDFKIAD